VIGPVCPPVRSTASSTSFVALSTAVTVAAGKATTPAPAGWGSLQTAFTLSMS
jgi:hypothetical protein